METESSTVDRDGDADEMMTHDVKAYWQQKCGI